MARRRTRAVRVGHLTIGGNHGIVIQSMTTTRPEDLEGSLAQIRALAAAGCPLVRLAVPTLAAAEALGPLRAAVEAEGLPVALSADVHFQPATALEAARHVDKVRINPGNYAETLEDARRSLAPLLECLRTRGAALRIGVNHGSLSARVADVHGHGPQAMVISAIEYLQLCRELGFEDLIVACKASNPVTMIAANRLLVEALDREDMDYPIHVGVTEAGEGLEGGLRSAVGIGTLLLEGIGDTIRVSMTGDPVEEIAACREIIAAAARALVESAPVAPRGAGVPPRVEVRMPLEGDVAEKIACVAGDRSAPAEAIVLQLCPGAQPSEYLQGFSDAPPVWIRAMPGVLPAPERLARANGLVLDHTHVPLLEHLAGSDTAIRWSLSLDEDVLRLAEEMVARTHDAGLRLAGFYCEGRELVALGRALAAAELGPITVQLPDSIWEAAVSGGALLIEGLVNSVCVTTEAREGAYALLQASGRRITRAQFISCPGCGRLGYDLTATVQRLKGRLGHLTGVKIAVMGCTVNGPGEMADADYGYVGAARGMVDLYAGQERIHRGLSPEEAEEALIALLRERGLWRDSRGAARP